MFLRFLYDVFYFPDYYFLVPYMFITPFTTSKRLNWILCGGFLCLFARLLYILLFSVVCVQILSQNLMIN